MKFDPIVKVENLKQHFELSSRQKIYAVDGVDLEVHRGTILGIVGESGCGKSTLAKTIMRLYKPTAGKIYINDEEWTNVPEALLRSKRVAVQMVFQDPYGTLNPRMKIGDAIMEPMKVHKICTTKKELIKRRDELLRMVELNPADADKYPHEFSGGQRQRIGIARALSTNPELLICDEPVSALDVSVQSQILNLLLDLKDKLDLTIIFIAHGLNVVKYISDRVAVMYLGKIVEIADSEELFANPRHPYTQILLSAIPIPDPDCQVTPMEMTGEIPSPANPPSGCKFHTRCPYATEECKKEMPELMDIGKHHLVACNRMEYEK